MDEKPVRGIDVLRRKRVRNGQIREHGEISPRRRPTYPISAERECMRGTLAYTEMVIQTVQPAINSVMRQYVERGEVRQDATGEFISTARGLRMAAAERLDRKKGALAKLEKQYARSGSIAKNHSIEDWNDQVRDALGFEINVKSYQEDMESMVQRWVHENVSKIQSIPNEYLAEVESIIRWGYETKQPKVNVYRKLEKLIGLTKSKAKMIARDQLGTLNYQMTRYEHESAGVGKYKWITKRDSRVRDSHRALHGTVHKWSEPPAEWYMTKSRGIVYTGRYCHPGESYGCRCSASPVFDIDIAKRYLANKFKPL